MMDNPGFYDVSDANFKKLIYRKQKLHELSETKLKRFNSGFEQFFNSFIIVYI